MQTALDSLPHPRKAPPPPAVVEDTVKWTELRALNEELKILHSTDLAARAWIESWGAFLAGAVTAKFGLDHVRAVPGPAWALALAGLLTGVLLVDVVRLRLAYRKLAGHEETRLARQRVLRRELGLEEAPVPSLEN